MNDFSNDATPDFSEIEFGTSNDGFPVARVGDNAFAMLTGSGGCRFLASGWRIPRPLSAWIRSDFYGHSGRLVDEADFRAKVLENAEHQRERRCLGRVEIRSSANTPWGGSQGALIYADGVVRHSTAGHGGFHLSVERSGQVHPMLRAEGGWYEEDCEWSIVAITFPQLFTAFERRAAEKTLKDWWPDAWETVFATTLGPGQSYEKDRRAFHAEHVDDWIVLSAIRSAEHPGMVEVVATRGGRRDRWVAERRFLVATDEYGTNGGRFGFVIDEARHHPYDGASSFIGVSATRKAS